MCNDSNQLISWSIVYLDPELCNWHFLKCNNPLLILNLLFLDFTTLPYSPQGPSVSTRINLKYSINSVLWLLKSLLIVGFILSANIVQLEYSWPLGCCGHIINCDLCDSYSLCTTLFQRHTSPNLSSYPSVSPFTLFPAPKCPSTLTLSPFILCGEEWTPLSCHEFMEVKGQLVGTGLLLPQDGFQRSNSGCPAWQQAPLSVEASCWPLIPLK